MLPAPVMLLFFCCVAPLYVGYAMRHGHLKKFQLLKANFFKTPYQHIWYSGVLINCMAVDLIKASRALLSV